MISPGLDVIHAQYSREGVRPLGCLQRLLGVAMISSLLLAPAVRAESAAGIDPLREPAQMIDARVPAPMIGIARAGDALVSVGPRGLVQRSEDGGRSWQQVPSPVSSDLVQVRFSDPNNGWITGHDAVVLHSSDGGKSWKVQLDGRSLLALLQDWYGRRANAGDQAADDMLREISMAMGTSATPDVLAAPFLDVLFDSSGKGFVVGAFGMILHSSDAGETWEPWVERTDNKRRMHLYGLAQHEGVFYVSGEQGLLMRLDQQAQRFVKLETPYTGTFFGVKAYADLLVTYGLRGNLYASRDEGRQWQKVESGLESSVVSMVEQGGELIIVSQSGQMVSINQQNLNFVPLQPARIGEVYAASYSGQVGTLVMTQLSGAKVVKISLAKED